VGQADRQYMDCFKAALQYNNTNTKYKLNNTIIRVPKLITNDLHNGSESIKTLAGQ